MVVEWERRVLLETLVLRLFQAPLVDRAYQAPKGSLVMWVIRESKEHRASLENLDLLVFQAARDHPDS
jgi:hypothetical protein